ncbi:MAG: hypothetical protein ACXVXI_11595, partial [Mycobacteriaceae bacterium]
VTIGGNFYALEGIARVWPNDGLVALGSAHADGVSERVLPRRVTRTFPDVHSIYFSHLLDLPWERALTWDPEVLGSVIHALERPIG